ncbi:MAG: aminopeptidase P family protein [Candidatus Sungbacteria bacterium]|nr:aminopeptidase P family protein [Candidatus Sungbacteria bacterium]
MLEKRGLTALEVHPFTPIEVVDRLRKSGIKIRIGQLPWYENRIVKTEKEISHITEVQNHMEDVLDLVQKRLRRASIKNGFIMEKGKTLTSEGLRSFIELELFRRGCASYDTIVSSGAQSAIPHHVGVGPLRANTSIIFDIYPYSRKTGYFSDMTRTFCKGDPPTLFVKMYEAVLAGQEKGIGMIRAGVDGKDIHVAIEELFAKAGFKTDLVKGRGFIHGTGHGLGLLCHEPPARINEGSYILKNGLVTSVEPGLYDPGNKLGVRTEDLVQVTKTGCWNLTKYPKQLKDIIIP